MVPLNSNPPNVDYPRSGHTRVSCDEPCELLTFDGCRRHGKIWNLSDKGVYVVVPAPFPPVGRTLLLSFVLAGDADAITCEARVEWHNGPSVIRGSGAVKPGLSPGCGLSFRSVTADDARRILARIVALHRRGLRA
jgi:hypothetical protein